MMKRESFKAMDARIAKEVREDEIEEGIIKPGAGRWYCGMCDKLVKKSGDCPACGFRLEKWPS